MICVLRIENFKSLRDVKFNFAKLNLFFGMNGMGKSSVLQSLLLLRQSYWANGKKDLNRLHINGDLICLGTGQDIFCQGTDGSSIRYYLEIENKTGKEIYDCCYDYKEASEDCLPALESVPVHDCSLSEPLFGRGFAYLGAEHIGPKNSYSMAQWQSEGINPRYADGRYTVPFLAKEGKREVPEVLRHEKAKTNSLIDQASAWMSEISPGVKLFARYLPEDNQAKLDVSYEGERLDSGRFSPVNVGFGIPYVVPLIVELLVSNKDSLLLIENPESHLHPKGQAEMAKLIARAAANGAQILCESHSDHLINGVRLAARQGEIHPGDIAVSYFDKNINQETRIVPIGIDHNGNLSEYPAGLLDEWGVLMAQLI